jgi:putative ABC transport system permease protein
MISIFKPAIKYVLRRRVRSALTIGGVAVAMFLFYSVQAMYQGVRDATQETAGDTKLIVYRMDRYCPFSSTLPQDYETKIAKVPGVKSVLPVKIVVNNCRTALDIVTFKGVPPDTLAHNMIGNIKLKEGSTDAWKARSDSAIIGPRLASKRGLKIGDSLAVSNITINVAGILDSTEPQDQNVAYTHIDFLQRSSDNKVGIVTQFNVTVNDPAQLNSVAKAIDETFRYSQDPTSTWSEKAFTARAANDIIELVKFARWLGWGCIAGVFALVFNAIVLSVRDRVRDYAVMQTLGYDRRLIIGLVITESVLLSLAGGLIGLGAGIILTNLGSFSITVEGESIHVHAGIASALFGIVLCTVIGILAGLVPALNASRRNIAQCFRAV